MLNDVDANAMVAQGLPDSIVFGITMFIKW